MPNYLWFIIGIVTAYLVTFGALVGWWFLLIRKDPTRTGEQIREDFDKIRRGIKGYEYERRN